MQIGKFGVDGKSPQSPHNKAALNPLKALSRMRGQSIVCSLMHQTCLQLPNCKNAETPGERYYIVRECVCVCVHMCVCMCIYTCAHLCECAHVVSVHHTLCNTSKTNGGDVH